MQWNFTYDRLWKLGLRRILLALKLTNLFRQRGSEKFLNRISKTDLEKNEKKIGFTLFLTVVKISNKLYLLNIDLERLKFLQIWKTSIFDKIFFFEKSKFNNCVKSNIDWKFGHLINPLYPSKPTKTLSFYKSINFDFWKIFNFTQPDINYVFEIWI